MYDPWHSSPENWIHSRYVRNTRFFPFPTIKVEDVRKSGSEIVPKMQIKKENHSQRNRTSTEDVRNALPTHGTADYSFADEIEIGETTIVSSFGEHVQVKMEYLPHDETSVERKIQPVNIPAIHKVRGPAPTVTSMEPLQENNELPFKCDYCELSFFNTRQLNNHRRNHQLEECPVCKKTLVARYLREHIALKHPHDDLLPDKRRYNCEHCDKTFSCKTLLVDHQRNHQTKECPVCNKTIKSRVLSMHMARKHPASIAPSEGCPFQCDQCDKSFVTKPQLVDHQRDHVLKNCPVCDVEILARCLKKHMARKHSPGGGNANLARMYKCEFCEKSYSNKRSLVLHQSNHSQTMQSIDSGRI